MSGGAACGGGVGVSVVVDAGGLSGAGVVCGVGVVCVGVCAGAMPTSDISAVPARRNER
jgi:hypothetical protein